MKILILAFLLIGLTAAFVMHAGALTWSVQEKRLTTYLGFDGLPAVLQTSDGTMWIFWTRKGQHYSIYCMKSYNGGLTWSDPTLVGGSFGDRTGISAFQASDGVIWLFWAFDLMGSFDIYYKKSSDLGVSWSDDIQLTTHPGRDLKPYARQLSNGTVWVAWASDRSGGYDLYLKTSTDNGVSWSDDLRLTSGPELDKSPSFVQLSDGVIWLFWSSDNGGKSDINYKTYNGFMWSAPTMLTDDPKEDTNPCALQTMDKKMWVFWASREPAVSEPTTDDIFYKYSSNNGVTWSAKIQFTTDSYDDVWPSVTQTSDTAVWVVWTSDRADQPDWGNWDIFCRKSLVGDVNSDGQVDIVDLSLVGVAFARFKGEPQYNPDADLNSDEIIDVIDVSLVSMNYGET